MGVGPILSILMICMGSTTTGGSTTTTRPRTTGITAAPSPVVLLTATLQEPFVEELNNRSSTEYRNLERQVVAICDFIFNERFGLLFIRTFVIQFRPQMGNIQAEVGLEFNNTASPDQIPQADVAAETLRVAVNNTSNTFNLTIDPASIEVIRSTTTTRPRTTGITAAPSPVVLLTATLQEPFVEELNNRSSAEYRNLERQVLAICDFIFSERFGLLFIRTFVIQFRPQMGNIQAEVGLEFNNTASPDRIPQADVVAETLRVAVNNASNTFNLSIDPASIKVIRSTTTTRPRTTGITAAPSPVVLLTATLQEPFVEELNNRSSAEYRNLERQVLAICDFIFSERFGLLFIRTFVIQFRPQMGNIQAEVGLEFNNTASPDRIPQADVVAETLRVAVNNASNTFNLSIDPASIEVIRK
ncbi:uncharacterized protein LOC127379519 isoform X13 [Dicentrarchus labrax]|uniref:uncharacterized protein LOC127379519 isoform X13 n=1 Tax=Dicentrarchus labrax TaxID=13489 RepID=UPI0021F5E184|nr:uncharacterized protein LOC127379519 isoform X13 [Dicentrarchus labrax]